MMSKLVPDDLQKEIRSVLLSKVGGIEVTKFITDYRKLVGQVLKYRNLGFNNIEELFHSIPNVARVVIGANNVVKVYGVQNNTLAYVNATAKKAQYHPREGEHLIINTQQQKTAKTHQPPRSSMTIDDEARQYAEQNVQSNLTGLWSLCFKRTRNLTREEIHSTFTEYGKVIDTSFTENYIFLRYGSKSEAVNAYVHKRVEYNLMFPTEKNSSRQVIKQNGVGGGPCGDTKRNPSVVDYGNDNQEDIQVFFGNLHADVTEDELWKLLEGTTVQDIKIRGNENRRFAFMLVNTRAAVDELVRRYHQQLFKGLHLIVQESFKDGGTVRKTQDDRALIMPLTSDGRRRQDSLANNMAALSVGPVSGHGHQGHRSDSGSSSPQRLNKNDDLSAFVGAGRGKTRMNSGSSQGGVWTCHQVESSIYDDMPPLDDDDGPPPLIENDVPYVENNKTLNNGIHGDNQHGGIQGSNQPKGQGHSPPIKDSGNHGHVDDNTRQVTYRPGEHKKSRPADNSYNFKVDDGTGEPGVFELFVGNFPFFTTWHQLLQLFVPFDATGVRMQNNQDTSRGTVAFVQFNDYEMAVNAFVNLDNIDYEGRPLRVNFAYNTFAPDDIVQNRMKNLKVKVKIENVDESDKSIERCVEIQGEDIPPQHSMPQDGDRSLPDQDTVRPVIQYQRHQGGGHRGQHYSEDPQQEYYEDYDGDYYEEYYDEDDGYYYEGQDGYYGDGPPGDGYYGNGSPQGGYQSDRLHRAGLLGDAPASQRSGNYGNMPYRGGHHRRPRGSFHGNPHFNIHRQQDGFHGPPRDGLLGDRPYQGGYLGHRVQQGNGLLGDRPYPGGYYGQGLQRGGFHGDGIHRGGHQGQQGSQGHLHGSHGPHGDGFEQHQACNQKQSSCQGSNRSDVQVNKHMEGGSHSKPQKSSAQKVSASPTSHLGNQNNRADKGRSGQQVSATPQGAALNKDTPQGSAVSKATPQGAVVNKATPQGAAVNKAPPQGAAVNKTTPQGAVVNKATPQGAVVNKATPQGAVVNKATPQGAAVNKATPQGIAVNKTTPRTAAAIVRDDYSDMPPLEDADEPPPPVAAPVPVQHNPSAIPVDDTPAMMQRHSLESMMRDVCPEDRLLTVEDMPPKISVLVMYKENKTYFWGHVLNEGFIEGVRALHAINQALVTQPPDEPIVGKRVVASYEGEWTRGWIYAGDTTRASVMYVDYGNTETVNRNALRGMSAALWKVAPQAVPFRIKDPSQTTVTEYQTEELLLVPSDPQDYIITVTK